MHSVAWPSDHGNDLLRVKGLIRFRRPARTCRRHPRRAAYDLSSGLAGRLARCGHPLASGPYHPRPRGRRSFRPFRGLQAGCLVRARSHHRCLKTKGVRHVRSCHHQWPRGSAGRSRDRGYRRVRPRHRGDRRSGLARRCRCHSGGRCDRPDRDSRRHRSPHPLRALAARPGRPYGRRGKAARGQQGVPVRRHHHDVRLRVLEAGRDAARRGEKPPRPVRYAMLQRLHAAPRRREPDGPIGPGGNPRPRESRLPDGQDVHHRHHPRPHGAPDELRRDLGGAENPRRRGRPGADPCRRQRPRHAYV